ncbi:hypothetical protein RP20_CCG022511 [Aedes albopictus]|nr:hypothetical protein RP20_CCG022511 [Aedes albopictus]
MLKRKECFFFVHSLGGLVTEGLTILLYLNTARSPIYSHLSASLSGLSTIRAFGAEKVLVREFDGHQDLHSSSFYLFISTSRAFGFYLDVFCVIYIAIVTLTFFINGDSGGNVGLAITQALGMTGMVQWGMRQSAELENTMTSVERVVEYDTVDPEPALEAEGEKKPPTEWPQEGHVKFDKLSLRYNPDPDTDRVLKGLEFDIQSREKTLGWYCGGEFPKHVSLGGQDYDVVEP